MSANAEHNAVVYKFYGRQSQASPTCLQQLFKSSTILVTLLAAPASSMEAVSGRTTLNDSAQAQEGFGEETTGIVSNAPYANENHNVEYRSQFASTS